MIYLLEDDNSIREFVIYTLNSQGLEAQGFERPSAFWAALEKDRPELVVLDVMLPEIDGIQLLRRMKADPALRDIPVIMATAKGAEYDKIRGLDLGADYYLVKPFGVMEMIARSLAGVFLVPALGYFGAALGSPLAWVAADIFLVPAYFRCRRVLMSQSHHLHVKAEEGEL